MHELSIATSIVKIAEDETLKVNASDVTKIELEIGALSGIEIDALKFVWSSAVKDSVLEKAVLEIVKIKGMAICENCNTEFELENIYDVCIKCNSNFKNITQGKGMKIKRLEVI
ncbi:hydrogenase maturation nickel metallochaperone HypA [Lutibacter citreus]|uniref:hydrogenase maturation nickel metallochaperone HypA n=1 Tax=Lutibacter citreus TaxID=2138210 RepID=UPI000DBE77B3|nr:hydrogenase maturation nickel metallochaperone HypA [Lutibacter citreus]